MAAVVVVSSVAAAVVVVSSVAAAVVVVSSPPAAVVVVSSLSLLQAATIRANTASRVKSLVNRTMRYLPRNR
jgi:hypothetical protein